jgi:histone deacetylase 1/2
MENSNSREYLEKITAAVIDNLRQTGPAPSVQMQDVPRKPLGAMTDEEEAELDDLDEDENKDVRMSEHQWDKHVVNPAEFEASDDDDLARANGATRQNGNKRTFTDHGENDANESEEKRAKTAEPMEEVEEPAAAEEAHDVNDDTVDDIQSGEKADAQPETKEAETTGEAPTKDGVDDEGDVGMAEAETAPATAEDSTVIKKEDGEPEATEQTEPAEEKEAEEPPAKDPTPPTTTDKTDETATEKATEKPTEDAPEEPKDKEMTEAAEAEKQADKPEEKQEKEEKADKEAETST